jgi:voltage-gated potassium channel
MDIREIEKNTNKWQKEVMSQSGILYAVFFAVGLVILGTVGYRFLEGWSWLDAFYTTVITVTTIGYGDFTPTNPNGKIFAVIFAVSAIGIVTYTFSSMAAWVIIREQARAIRKHQERKMKQISKLQNHVILCGGSVMGSQVVRVLHRNNIPFIVVEPEEEAMRQLMLYLRKDYLEQQVLQQYNPETIDSDTADYETEDIDELAKDTNVIYLQNDPAEDRTLVTAGIERARALIAAMPTDKDNMFVVLGARQLARKTNNPNLQIVSRVVDETNGSKIKAAGADSTLSLNFVGGLQLASNALEPEIAEFWNHLFLQQEEGLRMSVINLKDKPGISGQARF